MFSYFKIYSQSIDRQYLVLFLQLYVFTTFYFKMIIFNVEVGSFGFLEEYQCLTVLKGSIQE